MSTNEIIIGIIANSLCTSSMMISNKWALQFVPAPSLLCLMQVVFAAVSILILKFSGVEVDDLEWGKVIPYACYIVIFISVLQTSMYALHSSNIDTIIVFRSCVPIILSVAEYAMGNRTLPSLRSTLSMLCVTISAAVYCSLDSQFSMHELNAYFWVIAYFIAINIEGLFGKFIISSVNMKSVWGGVFYINLLAIPPMAVLAFLTGQLNHLFIEKTLSTITIDGYVIICASCLIGLFIG